MNMKKIAFWGSTGLLSLIMVAGGVADLLHAQPMVESFTHLGYPMYVATLLGIFKLGGVAALLVPGYEKLKEWAYAGFAFDLIGAAFSHAAVGDPFGPVVIPLVVLGIVVTSYRLRPFRTADPEDAPVAVSPTHA